MLNQLWGVAVPAPSGAGLRVRGGGGMTRNQEPAVEAAGLSKRGPYAMGHTYATFRLCSADPDSLMTPTS